MADLVKELQSKLARKWELVVAGTKPKPVPEPLPPPPTREQIQDDVIRAWAKQAPPEFFALLEDTIIITANEQSAAVDSHGKLAQLTGMLSAYTAIRARFVNWRDKR